MKNITEHIEKLIREHDCVIVPGLGGFLSNYESCHIDATKNVFFPSTKKIGFNIHLTHSDGLLAQSVMKAESLSYEQAMKLISSEIEKLRQSLNLERKVTFGNLGTLSLNDSRIIVFNPNNSFVVSAESYGLSSVYFLPLKKEQCLEKPHMLRKGFSSKLIWMSVAAVLLLFLLPVNLFDKKIDNINQASVFSVVLENNTDYLLQKNNQLVADTIQTELTELNNDSVSNYEALDSIENTANIIEKEVVVIELANTYHIIIASLPNHRLAEKYINEEAKYSILDDLDVVEKNNRCRISIKKFTNKSDAEFYLNNFKAHNPQYSSAWILNVQNN